jgi:hypothetical protein
MLPLISFETGRKTHTQSSGQQKDAVPANGGLVLDRNHGREANTPGEEIKTNLHPRSSGACRESLCPLDKDLSRKSHYRTSRIVDDFSSPVTALIWRRATGTP